jgi:Domain of unknown function (DUF4389)
VAEEMSNGTQPTNYPVDVGVEPQLADRNRLTVAFRLFLAIPHLVLVGGPPTIGVGLIFGVFSAWDGGAWGGFGFDGVLGAAAGVMAVISWFAIVFWNQHPRGLWDFADFYLRWKTRAVAYAAMLRDEYPPFGEGSYPTTWRVAGYPDQPRDKWAVGLRIIYVIPHIIVLLFLGIAWFVTSVIAWFAILFTGDYPAGLYNFAVGTMRWSLRVESYLLLMRDEYPPFSLNA